MPFDVDERFIGSLEETAAPEWRSEARRQHLLEYLEKNGAIGKVDPDTWRWVVRRRGKEQRAVDLQLLESVAAIWSHFRRPTGNPYINIRSLLEASLVPQTVPDERETMLRTDDESVHLTGQLAFLRHINLALTYLHVQQPQIVGRFSAKLRPVVRGAIENALDQGRQPKVVRQARVQSAVEKLRSALSSEEAAFVAALCGEAFGDDDPPLCRPTQKHTKSGTLCLTCYSTRIGRIRRRKTRANGSSPRSPV